MNEIMSFALTGIVISAVAEYTKNFLAKAGHRTLYVVGLSIVGGVIVYFGHLIPGSWITDFAGIWAAANTAYIAIVQWLPNTPVAAAPAPVATVAPSSTTTQ